MNLCGENQEGAPISTTSLSEGCNNQSKAISSTEHESPEYHVLSCVDMRRESMDLPIDLREGALSAKTRVHEKRTDSLVPSCVSIKSSKSMDGPIYFKKGGLTTDSGDHKEISKLSCSPSAETDLASIFKLLAENVATFVNKELKKFQRILSQDYLEGVESQKEAEVEGEEEEEEQRSSAREGALKITLHFLRKMKQHALADILENSPSDTLAAVVCQRMLKAKLKKKCEYVFEGIAKEGNSTLLNQIFTELFTIEGCGGEVNTKHEVRQIETKTRTFARPETPIKVNDIFKPTPGRDKPIRTVMTKGVAGIGKTVSTQKFSLDWAEGLDNQNIQFTFPILFRELNLLAKKSFSLIELLHQFYVETREITNFNKYQVVFILDGLDECRVPLDFANNEILTDVSKSAPVDVLLTNLIKGNLLPSARLWITTRPAAANQIPTEYVDMVTEIRGFTDLQKETYFRKRFNTKRKLSDRIIVHIKTSRSLHIMCHIPVFCLISATVLELVLTEGQSVQLPKTLTEMYIHFLVFQCKQKNFKYCNKAETESHWDTENRKIILSLGKLAFQQLDKGNLIFYESDLIECGIDVRAASVCSGVFTQIFREERGLYQDKMFCFVHLSIQEFLAAVYVIISFFNEKQNIMAEPHFPSSQSLDSVHKQAVDKALQNEQGHYDLFLRFLMGLSLDANQILLRGLLSQAGSTSENNKETIKYIKERMGKENLSPERCINLIHCLNELGDTSLVKEVQEFLTRGCFKLEDLSSAQSSALVFVLVTSEEELDVFDLKKYSRSEGGLLKMLPVIEAKTPRRLLLSACALTEEGCSSLASALSFNVSHLRELDLSYNPQGDSFVKLLSPLLEDSHCKLETLRLSHSAVTEEGCASLALALKSNPFHLRELELGNNPLRCLGVKLLCPLLKDPLCRLTSLRLSGCLVAESGCASLASAVKSNPSHLRELDLNYNQPGPLGEKLLSALLEDQHCQLEVLRLSGCSLKAEGSASLISALRSNPSHLRELDLSSNYPGHVALKLLSDLLNDTHCRLNTLRLSDCKLSAQFCEDLASALKSSDLRVLDLSNNDLQDTGLKLLSVGLLNPVCKLAVLRLSGCLITEEGCASLASALRSNPSHLRELDLSNNDLRDSGVKLLSAEISEKQCQLEALSFSGCLVTEEGCASLASALSSNPLHLRDLDLNYNDPGPKGLKMLSALLNDPQYKLQIFRVDHVGEFRIKTGPGKYACNLTLDPNTANNVLFLSEGNRKVKRMNEEEQYPDHPERFDWCPQVLSRESLTGSRCYWEVERKGWKIYVGVTYRGINRRGRGGDCLLGSNEKSWSLYCHDQGYVARHNGKETDIPVAPSGSTRVGVYLDQPSGILSFYKVSSDTRTLLHTFHSTFHDPLYAGFWLWDDSEVSLCQR